MDGKQLIKQEARNSEESQHAPRNLILTSLQETGFIEYMDQGAWHMAFYNDGKKMEQVFLLTTAIGKNSYPAIPILVVMLKSCIWKGIIEPDFQSDFNRFYFVLITLTSVYLLLLYTGVRGESCLSLKMDIMN